MSDTLKAGTPPSDSPNNTHPNADSNRSSAKILGQQKKKQLTFVILNRNGKQQRRVKTNSGHEQSDEDSIAEFEKIENQLDQKQESIVRSQKGKQKGKGIREQDQATPSQSQIQSPAKEGEVQQKQSKCFKIFCCGYCCSKNADSVKANEKKHETDLSPIKGQPIKQYVKTPKEQQMEGEQKKKGAVKKEAQNSQEDADDESQQNSNEIVSDNQQSDDDVPSKVSSQVNKKELDYEEDIQQNSSCSEDNEENYADGSLEFEMRDNNGQSVPVSPQMNINRNSVSPLERAPQTYSFEEEQEDDQFDNTQSNNEDPYYNSASKRMYVIHEEEDEGQSVVSKYQVPELHTANQVSPSKFGANMPSRGNSSNQVQFIDLAQSCSQIANSQDISPLEKSHKIPSVKQHMSKDSMSELQEMLSDERNQVPQSHRVSQKTDTNNEQAAQTVNKHRSMCEKISEPLSGLRKNNSLNNDSQEPISIMEQSQEPIIQVQPIQPNQDKPVIDKSKLTSNFYNNFDQFMKDTYDPLDEPLYIFDLKSSANSSMRKSSKELSRLKQNLKTNPKHKVLEERQNKKQLDKQSEVKDFKEKAIQKEKERKAKQQQAVVIQKNYRAYKQRKEYQQMKKTLESIKAFRQIAEKAIVFKKQQLLTTVKTTLKGGKDKLKQQEDELMNDFLNLCATNIQKFWKGSKIRKGEFKSLKNQQKALITIKAFIHGWRVRKVMQNKDIFIMRNLIKDLAKVQEYFLYVEECDNQQLLRQLKKDRRKAIQDFINAINQLTQTGDWVRGYIGNKIIERSQSQSTFEETEFKTPIKDFNSPQTDLKELVSTERFLYESDLQRNPYLFESDEFIRQKYLENKYKEYSGVKIDNDEFVKQNYLNVDSASKQGNTSKINKREESKDKLMFKKKGPSSFRSENPRDNVAIKSSKLPFEQMLANAMENQDAKSVNPLNSEIKKNFLKKKDKYDPKTAIEKGKGAINNKNVEKKRVFKSRKDSMEDESSVSVANFQKGTFQGHFYEPSVVLDETEPYEPKRTVQPPSLQEKLYQQFQKTQKFLQQESGKYMGGPGSQYQPFNQPYKKPSQYDQDNAPIVLGLDELEKVFQVYHQEGGTGKENNFFESESVKRDKKSEIPLLGKESLYMSCYDDSVYESVLADQKSQYAKLVVDKKKWMK